MNFQTKINEFLIKVNEFLNELMNFQIKNNELSTTLNELPITVNEKWLNLKIFLTAHAEISARLKLGSRLASCGIARKVKTHPCKLIIMTAKVVFVIFLFRFINTQNSMIKVVRIFF